MRIPEGPTLRPGMEDARVPLLRQRLNVAGDETSLRYDEALATAVKAYQKSNRMNADGMIGAATVRSLNAVAAPARSDVIDTVIANMERWRWIPRDLGNAHVMLNIPNYTLRVMHNGKEVWQTRVVVGKPTTATPLLTETMKFITVNPTWNVPPSIVQQRIPAGAGAGSDRARAHGPPGRQQPRRQRAHLSAARRQQRARAHPLQLPEPLPGLSARHAGQAPVRA